MDAAFENGASCTTRAAVIELLLDRIFKSRFESGSQEKIFAKVFRQLKKFVLVCRTDPALKTFSRFSETTSLSSAAKMRLLSVVRIVNRALRTQAH